VTIIEHLNLFKLLHCKIPNRVNTFELQQLVKQKAWFESSKHRFPTCLDSSRVIDSSHAITGLKPTASWP